MRSSVGLNYKEAQLKDHVCHWASNQTERIMMTSGSDHCLDKLPMVLTMAANSQRQDEHPIQHSVLRLMMPYIYTPGRYERVYHLTY